MGKLKSALFFVVVPVSVATADLQWFGQQDEFEAAMAVQGSVLAGVETFEESMLPVNAIDGLDNPLVGGVPNLPDGFPFPDGLSVLNLTLQSNIDGGDPTEPNPSASGLGAVSVGFAGAASDSVLASPFYQSLDLIFSGDDKTAVGFDTLSLMGGGTVDVRVYDTDNVFLGQMSSPADPAGSHFMGVSSDVPIGRINVFDPGGGAEGGDNIQIWMEGDLCGECPTDVDGSGDTGASDLAVLLGSWGPCVPGGSCECLDTDSDGVIGAADLAVLLGAWGLCP